VSLRDIVGQDRALRVLRSLLAGRAVPPALLFTGPEGVGKALTALQFAKALNCCGPGAAALEGRASSSPGEGQKSPNDGCKAGVPGVCPACLAVDKGISPDIHRVNAAYQASLLEEEESKQRSIRIDTVRHIIRDLEMRSLEDRWKVAVLEDAHQLVPAAANAMLKALEEPPPGTLWILATHRPEELLATVRSRCQTVRFAPLPRELVLSRLKELGVEAREAEAAASSSEGSLGLALRLARAPAADPSSWLPDPMGPFRLADGLPRELHKSRPLVAEELRRMAWHLRESRGSAGYAVPRVRAALRDLARLRRALDSNADPRVVVELAALAVQALETVSQERTAP